jgi:hypothetical protein
MREDIFQHRHQALVIGLADLQILRYIKLPVDEIAHGAGDAERHNRSDGKVSKQLIHVSW